MEPLAVLGSRGSLCLNGVLRPGSGCPLPVFLALPLACCWGITSVQRLALLLRPVVSEASGIPLDWGLVLPCRLAQLPPSSHAFLPSCSWPGCSRRDVQRCVRSQAGRALGITPLRGASRQSRLFSVDL